MKKLFFTALLAITLVTNALAGPAKISSAAKRNFEIEFNQATDVNWSAGDDYSKVSFTFNNERMEAFYSLYGDVIGISKAVSPDQLPVNAKRNLAKHFVGYIVKEAIRFDGSDETLYFISAKNEKEAVIIKVTDKGDVSIFKKIKK